MSQSIFASPSKSHGAYAPAVALSAGMFDFTVGNLDRASEVVSIAGSPAAPLRLYVGYGLDSVCERYREHLDARAQPETVTLSTL